MTTQGSLRLADVDPLVLTARARGGQIAGALLIDLALPLAGIIGGVAALITGGTGLGVALLLLAVALLAVTTAQIAHSGRALGGLAVGLRTVKTATGAAAGRDVLPSLFRGALQTFDLRRGRDPFAPALAPMPFPWHAGSAIGIAVLDALAADGGTANHGSPAVSPSAQRD